MMRRDAESPKSLIDKLAVKPNARVVVLGVSDEGFLSQLHERSTDVHFGEADGEWDVVFIQAEDREDLRRLRSLEARIKRNGTIWVVFPRGVRQIREADVFAAAKAAGLVDVKVVRFSDAHTGLKLVVPLARRRS